MDAVIRYFDETFQPRLSQVVDLNGKAVLRLCSQRAFKYTGPDHTYATSNARCMHYKNQLYQV